MDGFGHVEDDAGPEHFALQPEGSLNLIVFRRNWAY